MTQSKRNRYQLRREGASEKGFSQSNFLVSFSFIVSTAKGWNRSRIHLCWISPLIHSYSRSTVLCIIHTINCRHFQDLAWLVTCVCVFDSLSFMQFLLRFYVARWKPKTINWKHIQGTKNRLQHELSFENASLELQDFYKLTYIKRVCPFVFYRVNTIKLSIWHAFSSLNLHEIYLSKN